MSESDAISRKRSMALGSVIVVIFLAAVGFYYFFIKVHPPSPDDIVNVTVGPVKLPDGFERTLPKGVKALILVSEGTKDGGPIIRAVTADGTPINLCGSGPETECKLATSTNALMMIVSGASFSSRCGVCRDTIGYRRDCQKDTDKWTCKRGHQNCDNDCTS